MRRSYFRLLEGLLFSLPLLFASCGNGDNALEEIINGGGSGGGGGSTSTGTYLKWNGSDYDTPEIPSTAIDASTITTTINAGFYDVKGDVNLSGTITLAGNAEFVLRDGATLKITGAIVDNTETYNLTIYAQSEGTGMGKLDITSSGTDYPISANKLTVHGGEIIANTATAATAVNLAGGLDMLGGKLTASAIGTGIMVYGGVINVVKGTVDAKVTDNFTCAIDAAGIDMIVLGGTVKATTSGEGGCCINVDGDFTVYDGEIDARATGYSSGIQAYGATKKFTVSGGTITAKSGGGNTLAIYVRNEMEVNGGTINATAGADGTGIFVVNKNSAATPVFNVSGGTITAKGGNATVGNGNKGIEVNGDSKITGGTINATGGDATGYPGGSGFFSHNIYLAGCSVVAIGGDGTYTSGVLGTINFTTGSAKGCADGTSWNINYATGSSPSAKYFKYE